MKCFLISNSNEKEKMVNKLSKKLHIYIFLFCGSLLESNEICKIVVLVREKYLNFFVESAKRKSLENHYKRSSTLAY